MCDRQNDGLEPTAAFNQEAGDQDRQVGWRRLQALLQLALILIVHPLPTQGLPVLSLTRPQKRNGGFIQYAQHFQILVYTNRFLSHVTLF